MIVHSNLMDPVALHREGEFQLSTGCFPRKVSLGIMALPH